VLEQEDAPGHLASSSSYVITRCSAIAERPRCGCVSFGQKWKTGTGDSKNYGVNL